MKAPRATRSLTPPKGWQAVVSAILVLLAFPPFHFSLLVFVALVPWLIDLRSITGRRAWKSGYLFGYVTMTGQMAWILPFVGRWTGSYLLALIPWLLAAAISATYFAIAAVMIRICWARSCWWAIPVAWAGVEVFRSYIPVLAFPWALIATPLATFPAVIQTARDGTVYFVGAWVVLANVGLTMLMVKEEDFGVPRPVRWSGIAFLAILAWSLVRYSGPVEGEHFKATICQPGVDEAFGRPDENARILRESVRLCYAAAQANGSQLIVLPEGVSHAPSGMPPSTDFTVEKNPPIVFGGTRGIDPEYQDAFAFDGANWTYADKTRLVIFGEFVPMRWLPFLSRFNLPSGDLTAGKVVQPVAIGGLKVGPMLCFEGLFGDVAAQQVRRGARLLTVMSIDDWYMGSAAPEQLATGSIWRAVETGVPVLRSATLGYSMAVDQHGNVLARAPLFDRYALPVTVLLPKKPGTMPWLPLFPSVALISLPALLILRKRAPKLGAPV